MILNNGGQAIAVYDTSGKRVGHVSKSRFNHQPYVYFLMSSNEVHITLEVTAKNDLGDRTFKWNAIGSKANVVVTVTDINVYHNLIGAAVFEELLVEDL